MAGIPTLVALIALLPSSSSAQTSNPTQLDSPNTRSSGAASPGKLAPEQKFVVDTVRMAVALPEPDPQDRLRVLSTAADVVSPFDRRMAKTLWREGVQVESELIRLGQTPAVSMMSSGQADCMAAQAFVENLPPEAALPAEQSLIGATTSCSKRTLDIVSRKLDAALEKGIVPARALLAAMEAHGTKAPWSQSRFEKMFKSLPNPQPNSAEAENFAGAYSRMAGEVDNGAAQAAGVRTLNWLGKLDDSPRRSLAIHITVQAMQHALGEEGFRQAMQSDIGAQTIAKKGTQDQPIERAPNRTTSVLDALRDRGSDPSEHLRDLPPGERARQAAAHGFASGTGGDKGQASKHFDLAFAATDEAWAARSDDATAAAVVQEVGEAAAQVDPLNALERAQKLHDTAAQAIAMLAVARVVASTGLAAESRPAPR